MPSRQEHLDKAEHNENIARQILMPNNSCLDWAVIALFYSAAHYVDAYIMQILPEPSSHEERFDYIRRANRHLYPVYRNLFDEGWKARYDVYNIDSSRLQTEIITHFETIKNSTQNTIS